MASGLDTDVLTPPTAEKVIPEERKKTLWTGFLSFVWDSDTHLKSKEERRLLYKLDCAMLTCLCLGDYSTLTWKSYADEGGIRVLQQVSQEALGSIRSHSF
jgi:hypothetical protein